MLHFAGIDFDVDIARRKARLKVSGYIDTHGEPILNPVTGKNIASALTAQNGFEYRLAEAGLLGHFYGRCIS